MSPRHILFLAGTLALLSAPAMADPPVAAAPPASDGAPVSTASQTTDAKISAWLHDDDRTSQTDGSDEPAADMPPPKPDRRIHGEVGAAIGSHGYRSAFGVATIPLGQSSSATVAISTGHGPYPFIADGPWYAGPVGPGVRASCVCREAPDGSEQCRPAGAATRLDAQMAAAACQPAY